MIYSRWRPDVGGYEYFESTERRGLGDDLPMPKLPAGTAIGVASTDIGRPAPGALRPAGSGPVPKGSILPLSREGLSGVFGPLSMLPWWVSAALAGVAAGVIVWEIKRSGS
jgi:hypothetical protein